MFLSLLIEYWRELLMIIGWGAAAWAFWDRSKIKKDVIRLRHGQECLRPAMYIDKEGYGTVGMKHTKCEERGKFIDA